MATVRLQLGPADHGRAMTLEEFRDADEVGGYRFELARGIVEVTEVPNDPHGQIVDNLVQMIYRFRMANPHVIRRVGGAGEFRVWIPEMVSGRNPDVAVVLRATGPDHRGRRPPSLVAEVVSRRGEDRDYRAKREEYWVYGIQEYWIVDPMLRQVMVLTRRGDAWDERIFRDDEPVVSSLLPGLIGTVANLWDDVEDED